MTIHAFVESCELSDHRKSAKLRLRDNPTRYTLFDTKLVPSLQPDTEIKFEAALREYKGTEYWAVVDGSLRIRGQQPPTSNAAAYEASTAPSGNSVDADYLSNSIKHHLGLMDQILERLTEISGKLDNRVTPKKAPLPPPDTFDDDLPF